MHLRLAPRRACPNSMSGFTTSRSAASQGCAVMSAPQSVPAVTCATRSGTSRPASRLICDASSRLASYSRTFFRAILCLRAAAAGEGWGEQAGAVGRRACVPVALRRARARTAQRRARAPRSAPRQVPSPTRGRVGGWRLAATGWGGGAHTPILVGAPPLASRAAHRAPRTAWGAAPLMIGGAQRCAAARRGAGARAHGEGKGAAQVVGGRCLGGRAFRGAQKAGKGGTRCAKCVRRWTGAAGGGGVGWGGRLVGWRFWRRPPPISFSSAVATGGGDCYYNATCVCVWRAPDIGARARKRGERRDSARNGSLRRRRGRDEAARRGDLLGLVGGLGVRDERLGATLCSSTAKTRAVRKRQEAPEGEGKMDGHAAGAGARAHYAAPLSAAVSSKEPIASSQ